MQPLGYKQQQMCKGIPIYVQVRVYIKYSETCVYMSHTFIWLGVAVP